MEWVTMESPFPWLTSCTMQCGGAFHNVESGLFCLPISMDSPQEKYYLTLNIGEKPRVPNPTHLSDILEPNVDKKYQLSSRACKGIINRADRRGKQLPEILRRALESQLGNDPDSTDEGAELS